MNKLNIGCGTEKLEGYVNIDIAPEVHPDYIVDIEVGLPFKDNTFEEIRMHRILEHVCCCKMRFVLNEISRVAKEGCIWDIIVPFDNHHQRGMIDHKRGFTWNSFWALEQPINMDSPSIKLRLERLHKNPNILVRWFFYMFPMLYPHELHFKYRIRKEEE